MTSKKNNLSVKTTTLFQEAAKECLLKFFKLILRFVFPAFFLAACQGGQEKQSPALEAPYEVVIENLTRGESMPDLTAVEEAVNKITIPAIGCSVKIENVSIGNQKSALRLKHAQKAQMDLVNVGRMDPIIDMVADKLLLPLDELLISHGPSLLESYGDVLNACRLDGRLYAVPASLYVTSEIGFLYNADMASRYGIHFSSPPTMEEIEEAARILKSHGKYLLYPDDKAEITGLFHALYPQLKDVSGSFMYGVLRPQDEEGKIISLYESEEFMDYCLRIRNWASQGWIPENYLLWGLRAGEAAFNNGDILMVWSGTGPIERSLQAKSYPFAIGMLTTGQDPISTQMVQANAWGISVDSKRPEKAMEFLNFLYENAKVANLLMNGLEGRHYVKLSEHIITFLEGQRASDLGYTRTFTLYGDYRDIYEWSPMTEEDYEELKAYYGRKPEIDSLFGYVFDVSPVAAEAAAISHLLSDYLPALECGLIEDVPSALVDLNHKLKEAGMDRVLAENQRQLDAFLS